MKRVIRISESDIRKLVCEAIDNMVNKPALTILWLDDMRSPEKYLNSKKTSNTFVRNSEFYKKIYQKYNPKFIWVHNLEEFSKYIQTNGVPDLISFDFDLGAGIPKGSECAKWLFNYCKQNNKPLPKYFIHSANNNAQKYIPNEFGTQTKLSEMVYVNGINGRKANLTYNTNTKNRDNKFLKGDNLSTDKMDQNNDETIEVPLKGGLMSYNITGINGTYVMHYFKKYFQHEKEKIKDEKGKEYELEMLSSEFNEFMKQFKEKVWTVVKSVTNNFQKEDKTFNPVAISLYPVPSSSNFNIQMAKILEGGDIGGLPIQIISQNLFVKDLRNLTLDNEFIEKNKDFYAGDKYKQNNEYFNGTYIQNTQNAILKQQKITELQKYVDLANEFSECVMHGFNNYKTQQKQGNTGKRLLQNLVKNYKLFCDAIRYIELNARYVDTVTNKTKRINIKKDGQKGGIYQYIKGFKPASVDQRSEAIWQIVAPYLSDMVSDVDGQPYHKENVVEFDKIAFQIKKLSDGERMALKNIYNPNTDEGFVRNEVEKTKNTVFVIFDDNISGGSTLSDVCYQAKQLGIEHIIPITFGKMAVGSSGGGRPINTPINNKGERGYNY